MKHAEAAWPAWSATSASVKAAALRKLADLIIANGQELAEVECKTMGKYEQNTVHSGSDDLILIGFLHIDPSPSSSGTFGSCPRRYTTLHRSWKRQLRRCRLTHRVS